MDDLLEKFNENSVETDRIYDSDRFQPTEFGEDLIGYLNRRNEFIETDVKSNLMDRAEAKAAFESVQEEYDVDVALKRNKQTGDMDHYAYLTCIVNILTQHHLDDHEFDPDPQGLTVAQEENTLLRTFSRRMDGAYPSRFSPVATWEIKEYYDNKTFGSRISDGVYITMLDGEEMNELEEMEGEKIYHYLIADDYDTWWERGTSYLCRMVDIVNMGLVDEILIGREVLTRWPEIVEEMKLDADEYQNSVLPSE